MKKLEKEKEEALIAEVQKTALPVHIAIVMDGNGRWAANKGQTRLKGHLAGAEAIRRTIMAARKIGLRYLTLYAFSTENWKRPKSEVSGLFSLMSRFLKSETSRMIKNDVRLSTIGDISKIPDGPRKNLEASMKKTAHCQSLTVFVALNYGSRQEIARAFNRIMTDRKDSSFEITPEDIDAHLDTVGIPDPELMIRTSGEQRISNFLLWQLSYAELYFTPALWPDFDGQDLCKAIEDFQKRKRRFGGL